MNTFIFWCCYACGGGEKLVLCGSFSCAVLQSIFGCLKLGTLVNIFGVLLILLLIIKLFVLGIIKFVCYICFRYSKFVCYYLCYIYMVP